MVKWNTVEQLIRYALTIGGSVWLGSNVVDGDLFQSAIGGAVSLSAFVWWIVWERGTEHTPKKVQ